MIKINLEIYQNELFGGHQPREASEMFFILNHTLEKNLRYVLLQLTQYSKSGIVY